MIDFCDEMGGGKKSTKGNILIHQFKLNNTLFLSEAHFTVSIGYFDPIVVQLTEQNCHE